jgi:transcriptional regulator with PAS, ATPase and Fis domain
VIVATSAEMRHLLATCDRYAGLDVPILVTGETGTGKELIVWRLHNRGKHRDGPLVAVNCAAIPHEIFERELFGHARGAYTGAENNGPGLVAQAEGGTLLLDEIGDLPPMLQPKLLRLLENGTYRRLGDPTERHAHIRLVAATNANLARMTDDGSFRADLLYRLRELEISIPPLRLRRADIVPLFEHFLELMEGRRIEIGEVLTVAEIDNLKSAHLPGNARELRQLARLTLLDADIAYSLEPCPEDGSNLDDVLEKCGGNKAEAARRLGISRSTLYRRLHVTREG